MLIRSRLERLKRVFSAAYHLWTHSLRVDAIAVSLAESITVLCNKTETGELVTNEAIRGTNIESFIGRDGEPPILGSRAAAKGSSHYCLNFPVISRLQNSFQNTALFVQHKVTLEVNCHRHQVHAY